MIVENARGIRATCGDCGQVQTVRFGEGMTREMAETQAGMLDGSSPLFKFPPPITKKGDPPSGAPGQCGICGGHFTCAVFGFDEAQP